MTHRLKAYVLALVSALLIFCYSCKKNSVDAINASIVGSWSISNITQQLYVGNTLTFDTSVASTGSPFDITFLSNGFYTELSGGSLMGGAYTLYGDTLSIFDTAYLQNNWFQIHVSKLDAHNLSLVDTVSNSHDSIGLFIENFTR